VEIGSLTYGLSVHGSPTDPVGARPSVDQLVVSKRVDSASLPLLKALAEGTLVRTGRISFRRAGATTSTPPPPFLVIDPSGVHVRQVEVESNGGDEVSERVALAFQQILWTYTSVSPTGTVGTKMTYSYSIPLA
jgi:type VI protein secretion system component Hcp